jgi:hypothetical protein
MADLQTLINQQGLTAAQAMEKYGIGQDVIDGLAKQGVTFSAGGTVPGVVGSPWTPGGNYFTSSANGVTTGMGSTVAPAPAPNYTTGQVDTWINGTNGQGRSEFTGMNQVNQAFMTSLGRLPSPQDQLYYSNLIASGGDINGIVSNIGSSPEAQAFAASGATNPYAKSAQIMTDQSAGIDTGTEAYRTTNNIGVPTNNRTSTFDANSDAARQADSILAGGLMDATAPRNRASRDARREQRRNRGGATDAIPATPGGTTTAPTGGGFGGNNYTPTTTPAQPVGGTVLPASGDMPAVTVPNAKQASVGNIGVSSAALAAPVTAPQASVTDGQAKTWTPDANSTVQGQIRNVIAEDSPLMQQAATRGLQQANRRGLMNSSMAVQSGQAALYDAALPIASQDASTFARSGEFNAQAGTQVSMANAAARNSMAQFNADTLFKTGVVNQDQFNKMAQFNASEANRSIQLELQVDADIQKFNASESNSLIKLGMDSQTKLGLANIEASYKMLMQTSASSAEVYKSMIGQMGAILGNKDMDAAAKAAAIQNLIGALNASLGVMGAISNLDLPELDFSSIPAGGTPAATPAPTPAPGGGSGYEYPGGDAGPGNGA